MSAVPGLPAWSSCSDHVFDFMLPGWLRCNDFASTKPSRTEPVPTAAGVPLHSGPQGGGLHPRRRPGARPALEMRAVHPSPGAHACHACMPLPGSCLTTWSNWLCMLTIRDSRGICNKAFRLCCWSKHAGRRKAGPAAGLWRQYLTYVGLKPPKCLLSCSGWWDGRSTGAQYDHCVMALPTCAIWFPPLSCPLH